MGPRRTLFLVFLRIGGGMIGGGYSMLPLIQREVEQRWQDKLVFSEALPLAQ
ncbi:MAG TPA: chromate transporter, partial [Spirochaetota bacterium]|nr:chromate transporter [Spirochaetota bacterium]